MQTQKPIVLTVGMLSNEIRLSNSCEIQPVTHAVVSSITAVPFRSCRLCNGEGSGSEGTTFRERDACSLSAAAEKIEIRAGPQLGFSTGNRVPL